MYKTLIIFSTILCLANATHTKIKLADVNALTFKDNEQTTGRRISPVSQLACQGYNCKYAPDTIQCTNKGTDGLSIQWECKADIDSSLRLKLDHVSCEGYENANDPYILVGSCSINYSLIGNVSGETVGGKYNNNGLIFFGTVLFALICSGCGRRNGNNFLAGAAGGAAGGALTAYALNNNRGWVGRRRYRRRQRGGQFFRTRRTSRGFCGTRNR